MPTGCTLIRIIAGPYVVAMALLQLAMARAFDPGVKLALARSEWLSAP